MYYVYILKDATNKFYKGFTSDLRNRLEIHRKRKVKSTKNGFWKLVYYEAFLSKTTARKEELFLKSGKGRERIRFLLGEV